MQAVKYSPNISNNAKRVERFWSKVQKTDHCWIWTGHCLTSKWPYGQFWLGNGIQKHIYAHRFSAFLHFGDIQDKIVCHKCDNPRCVNPEHLFVGTIKDNMRDMYNKGRNVHYKGSLNHNSKLTESDVAIIRKNTTLSVKQLSDKFGVHQDTVRAVINRRNWKHI
jgi:hypothetical protein